MWLPVYEREKRRRVHLTEPFGYWEALKHREREGRKENRRSWSTTEVQSSYICLLILLTLWGASFKETMDSCTEIFFRLLFLVPLHPWNILAAGEICEYYQWILNLDQTVLQNLGLIVMKGGL